MTKNLWISIISTIVLIGCLYYWVVNYSPSVPDKNKELLEKIDNLYTKVYSIRRANDIIKVIIDTKEVEN